MRISVVIPLYNKSAWIGHCLESVLAQTHKPDEIIVIDDGSSDHSADQVLALARRRPDAPIRIYRQQNRGVAHARNHCMSLTRNDLIAFLDADDCWQPDYLQQMARLVQGCPDAAIYSSYHRIHDQAGKVFSLPTPLAPGFMGYVDNYFSATRNTYLIRTSCTIVRKTQTLAVGGFPEKARVAEDLYLWFRLVSSYRFAHLNKELVVVNQYPDESRDVRSGELPWLIRHFTDAPAEFSQLSAAQRSYIGNVHTNHILSSLAAGNRAEGYERLKAGSRLFPARTLGLAMLLLLPMSTYAGLKQMRRSVFDRMHASRSRQQP